MKILQIHNKYKYRGGEDAIAQIEVDLLIEKGIKVEVLYFSNEKIDPLKTFKNSVSEKKVLEKIKIFSPDVIHIHNLFYQATPSIINVIKKIGIPVVMTLHNYRLICTGALLMRDNEICTKCVHKKLPIYPVLHKCFQQSAFKSLLLTSVTGLHKIFGTWNKIDKFIVLTSFAKERILNSSLNLKESQIEVKANSVSGNEVLEPEKREDYFLFVGRISSEKGIDVIAKTFKQSDLKLEVIGDGPLLDWWKKNANANVTFHQQQPSSFVIEKMQKCKGLIVASTCYEGLPTNILEAFSVGTPVIYSDIDNINTIVTDNYNGFLFQTGSSSSLLKTVSEYKFEELISENAKKTFLAKYSKNKNVEQLISIYKSVING